MKEVIIFKVRKPHSQEEADSYKLLQKRLDNLYKETNQIPLVVTDDIEIIKQNN